MISHNNKKRTWHRAAALLLSASLLLTACGAQNNNDNIFSPILPDNSPASSTDPDDKLPDPVTIVVEDDSVAPSKTFNLAGLQISNIFIPNEKLRKAFQTEIDKTGYDEPNALGIVACEAAYRAGEDWLDQLRAYLLKNLNFLRNFLQEKIPQIHLVEPEGTYLVWLDCSELGITGEELDQFIVDKAGLWLDGGSMFGPSGAAFQRVNIACPQATLELALNKLKAAVDNLE